MKLASEVLYFKNGQLLANFYRSLLKSNFSVFYEITLATWNGFIPQDLGFLLGSVGKVCKENALESITILKLGIFVIFRASYLVENVSSIWEDDIFWQEGSYHRGFVLLQYVYVIPEWKCLPVSLQSCALLCSVWDQKLGVFGQWSSVVALGLKLKPCGK